MDLIHGLKNIGFTKQEAIIYITLCQNGELSGYEVAKVTGISRSNAYASLSTLVEKGGALIVEHSKTKYIATPKEELLSNIKRDFDKTINYLDEHLDFSPICHEPYITVLGKKNIHDKIINMINLAEMRIYISADHEELNLFADELMGAKERGLKVVIITNEDFPYSSTTYMAKNMIQDNFKMIVDTKEVISGKLISSFEALYSKNSTLVNIIREAFINEIELITMQD
ncbi:TrmB family transcriptional regulator [Vallitalea okinawensis]|uniref:TrmB family transcriptional regulator n=1 Tax=Vallitalea okinawensis TaxID=2078660 RepID=UPI000CFC9605|nr:helix-turn-helix domain-containing protein [Vallitalea okinawensis]